MREIADVSTEPSIVCHRCQSSAILSVRVPHVIERADGTKIDGTRGVVLCSLCDRDEPAAQGLLAFFAVNDQISEEDVESAALLILEWSSRMAELQGRAPDSESDDDIMECLRQLDE